MKRCLLGLGVALLLLPAGSARAQVGHSAGVQVLGIPLFGAYKTYGGGFSNGFSSPGYGFASPSFSAPMMSFGNGCSGFNAFSSPSFGFASPSFSAPMMSFGHGCSGFNAFSSPSFGYGTPQNAFPGFGGGGFGGSSGILEILQVMKVLQETFGKQPPVPESETKKAIEDLRTAVKSLETRIDNLKIPDDAVNQLKEVNTAVKAIQNVRLPAIEAKIADLEAKIKK